MTNAFSSEIRGGSFYGKVDNRDRSDFRPTYRGILAGGTFYADNPGTIADDCCTVTYDYGKVDGTSDLPELLQCRRHDGGRGGRHRGQGDIGLR